MRGVKEESPQMRGKRRLDLAVLAFFLLVVG